jgi:hypothetical protein
MPLHDLSPEYITWAQAHTTEQTHAGLQNAATHKRTMQAWGCSYRALVGHASVACT